MLAIILAFIVIGISWYLFIRPGEFEVKFKASTLPGDLIQVIKIWNRSLEDATITEVDSFKYIRQKIIVDGREYLYEWNFKMPDDSTTRINIVLSQKGRKLSNKILVPFSNPPIEIDASRLAHEFYNVLTEHLRITKVQIEGLSEIEENFCVCTQMQSDQLDKAVGMMRTYNFMISFIENNSLKVAGKPIVDVREWDHEQSMLKYDFCFPIAAPEDLPANEYITYKMINKRKALKAIYNGNYITSDRAWYYLIHYAEKNDFKIAGLPMEVFYNNPNIDMNEIKWKAEIFLPVN